MSTNQLVSQVPKPLEVTPPVTEPVTISEAKKQVEVAQSDTSHDAILLRLITAARQQWEKDTGEYYVQRQMELQLPEFAEFQFPHRPVSQINEIKYYDVANTINTLDTAVYQLDRARSQLRLGDGQTWPTTTQRWDAVFIDYVLGASTNSTTVPAVARQAMLLLVGYYFEQRGDNDRANDMRAYEALVAKNIRSSYP